MAVKEFPCGHCGKVFSQIGNLQRHVAVMHEDPKLQCAECPQMFHHKVFSHLPTVSNTSPFHPSLPHVHPFFLKTRKASVKGIINGFAA